MATVKIIQKCEEKMKKMSLIYLVVIVLLFFGSFSAAEKMAETKKGMGPAWEFVKTKLEFPEYFPAMQNFQIFDNNIVIKTHDRDFDRHVVKFILMDVHGNKQRSVFLPYVDSLYTIQNNTYFYLLENEENEIWELHGMKI